jgi:D-alanyl-D-alanine carboxypeptidase (penicillin-binding protein 5/6)
MRKKFASLLSCWLLFLSFDTAMAATDKKRNKKAVIVKSQGFVPTRVETSLVVDSKNGKVLHAQNANIRIYPASLTKVMTLYLTFEALESGKLSMDKKLYISDEAVKRPPCKLDVKAGEYITVRDAILSQIIKSANNISVVLAENISGSEEKFAEMMTRRARQLGMNNTVFKNASGLHHPEQKTTALDLAKLSIAIKRDYAKYYPLFSRTSFEFRGKTVNGHNPVVANYNGAEGLKTGFTGPAGYNLITTASRGSKSLIGVVTGTNNKQVRDKKMVTLLDTHFGINKAKPEKKATKTAYNTKKKVIRS